MKIIAIILFFKLLPTELKQIKVKAVFNKLMKYYLLKIKLNPYFYRVKIIIYLFSFYIILLSGMPCVDAEPTLLHEKVTLNDSSQHHHDNDSCSPLCICNCCGTPGFAYDTIPVYAFFSVPILIDKKTPEYQSISASNFYGSIWQPPQINA
jgi:hypothetical protein